MLEKGIPFLASSFLNASSSKESIVVFPRLSSILPVSSSFCSKDKPAKSKTFPSLAVSSLKSLDIFSPFMKIFLTFSNLLYPI